MQYVLNSDNFEKNAFEFPVNSNIASSPYAQMLQFLKDKNHTVGK